MYWCIRNVVRKYRTTFANNKCFLPITGSPEIPDCLARQKEHRRLKMQPGNTGLPGNINDKRQSAPIKQSGIPGLPSEGNKRRKEGNARVRLLFEWRRTKQSRLGRNCNRNCSGCEGEAMPPQPERTARKRPQRCDNGRKISCTGHG